MAQYLIITIFWGFGLVISSETNKTRWIALICTILSFAALLVTFSRGAIISTIIGGLLFSYLHIKKKGFNNVSKRKLKLILALFITALVIGIFISEKTTDGKTFIQIIDMFERADSDRLMIWREAINALSLNPLNGSGLGNYRLAWHIYVHNEILQMLVETGIIGLSGFLFFLFFVFKKIQQQYVTIHSVERKALCLGILTGTFATLMHSMVSFNLHSATSSFFFFLGLGILCAVNVTHKQNKRLPRNTIVKNVIALMIVVSISLWAIYGEYRIIMSHYYVSKALVSENQEETFQSLDYILKAIQYQPYNSEYHSIAGRIYWKTDQRELANRYLKKAEILSLHK
jgi:O-antigen ligase